MTIQLPNSALHLLPFLMSTASAMAVLGLVYTLATLIFMRRPVAGHEGDSPTPYLAKVAKMVAKRAGFIFWLSLTGLHLLAWHLYLSSEEKNQLHGLSYFSTYLAILLGWQLWQRTSTGRWNKTSPIAVQCLQVVGLTICSSLLSDGPTNDFQLVPPGKLVVCEIAHTDAGTPINLYDRQAESVELEKFFVSTQAQISNLTRQAMFRGEAAPQVNCHGWVFSGQHIIKGEDVPTILQENGYEVVDQPKLQDLVVYADDHGTVMHTGLVCGFFGEGTPLIQSKWGVGGIYVHLVDEQPYSDQYRFYRSARNGHCLISREPAGAGLAQNAPSSPLPNCTQCNKPYRLALLRNDDWDSAD